MKENELVCSMNHKLPISMVICDKNLANNKRLLCQECINNLESKLNNAMSWHQVVLSIENNQKMKVESVQQCIKMNTLQIEELKNTLNQLKSQIIQQLDEIINIIDEWIKCLKYFEQQNLIYSFHEELDKLIDQVNNTEFDQKPLIAEIRQINNSYNQKFIKNLDQFSSFELVKKCKQSLTNLENINQCTVQFKLIDDLNKQCLCYAIAFNNTGSIMISTYGNDIKVWNFTQGKLRLSNQLKGHQKIIQCLVYSKKRNSFISGCLDTSLICWKQINNNEWKCSQPYQQHTDEVECLILNKQEDQLISGSRDNSIKIWNVDFIENQITYLYSLDNIKSVYSLSFNQSETMLASCAKCFYQIWEKGVEDKWELKCIIDGIYIQIIKQINSQIKIKYKSQISEGYQIYFISDQQFLWVTKDKNIDQIMIFELQDGVFKQNSDKTIQLIENQLCEDYSINFPIVYNTDENLLLVRHKHHIYLIKKVNDGKFKITGSLNCENEFIYGTMTNDAKYLVFQDGKKNKYSSYELLFK